MIQQHRLKWSRCFLHNKSVLKCHCTAVNVVKLLACHPETDQINTCAQRSHSVLYLWQLTATILRLFAPCSLLTFYEKKKNKGPLVVLPLQCVRFHIILIFNQLQSLDWSLFIFTCLPVMAAAYNHATPQHFSSDLFTRDQIIAWMYRLISVLEQTSTSSSAHTLS